MDSYKGDEGFKDLHNSLSKIDALLNKFDDDNRDLKTIKKLKEEIVKFRNSLI